MKNIRRNGFKSLFTEIVLMYCNGTFINFDETSSNQLLCFDFHDIIVLYIEFLPNPEYNFLQQVSFVQLYTQV